MIKRSTLIEMLVLVIAASILVMALLSFNVNAQELASAATIDPNTGKIAASNITPLSDNSTSVSGSSDNSALTKAEILKQKGVPGKGINKAPGLQKPFNPKAAGPAGIKKFLTRFHHRFQEMIQKQVRGTF